MRPAPVEEMEVAVRAWPVPDYLRHLQSTGVLNRSAVDLGPSEWSVTFDTETTTDTSQRLRVGAYQVRYHDDLFESGFFHEPGELTPAELDTLTSFCAEEGHRMLTRSEFVDEVLLHYCYDLRGQ